MLLALEVQHGGIAQSLEDNVSHLCAIPDLQKPDKKSEQQRWQSLQPLVSLYLSAL